MMKQCQYSCFPTSVEMTRRSYDGVVVFQFRLPHDVGMSQCLNPSVTHWESLSHKGGDEPLSECSWSGNIGSPPRRGGWAGSAESSDTEPRVFSTYVGMDLTLNHLMEAYEYHPTGVGMDPSFAS